MTLKCIEVADPCLSGINDESSFEAALLEKTQYCQVWGYDSYAQDVRVSSDFSVTLPAGRDFLLRSRFLHVPALVRARSTRQAASQITLALPPVGLIRRGRSDSQPAHIHPSESDEDERYGSACDSRETRTLTEHLCRPLFHRHSQNRCRGTGVRGPTILLPCVQGQSPPDWPTSARDPCTF